MHVSVSVWHMSSSCMHDGGTAGTEQRQHSAGVIITRHMDPTGEILREASNV